MIVRIKWILPCRLLLLIIAPRSVKKQGKAAEIYHSKGRQQKKRIVWPKLGLGPYRAAVQRTSRVQENTPFPVAAYIGGKEVII